MSTIEIRCEHCKEVKPRHAALFGINLCKECDEKSGNGIKEKYVKTKNVVDSA